MSQEERKFKDILDHAYVILNVYDFLERIDHFITKSYLVIPEFSHNPPFHPRMSELNPESRTVSEVAILRFALKLHRMVRFLVRKWSFVSIMHNMDQTPSQYTAFGKSAVESCFYASIIKKGRLNLEVISPAL